ncbi:hypothetical protein HAX54_052686 [Datura stramonium]|uniref:Uncharacterized protein n=1 Tax=Datura stramonium TaxID=4076 RepID=A0ABS8SZV1_DATST|nr:hypothetical protein [Datura stramonium]
MDYRSGNFPREPTTNPTGRCEKQLAVGPIVAAPFAFKPLSGTHSTTQTMAVGSTNVLLNPLIGSILTLDHFSKVGFHEQKQWVILSTNDPYCGSSKVWCCFTKLAITFYSELRFMQGRTRWKETQRDLIWYIESPKNNL